VCFLWEVWGYSVAHNSLEFCNEKFSHQKAGEVRMKSREGAGIIMLALSLFKHCERPGACKTNRLSTKSNDEITNILARLILGFDIVSRDSSGGVPSTGSLIQSLSLRNHVRSNLNFPAVIDLVVPLSFICTKITTINTGLLDISELIKKRDYEGENLKAYDDDKS
jgi:hypothetical protein